MGGQMKNDFLTKRFKLEAIYNWESEKFLKNSIQLVKDTETYNLVRIYDKPSNKFLDRLNQLVDK